MAEFQWWLLIVGLVAGGGLVAIVSADSRRREEDLADLERQAEATWIADRLTSLDADLDVGTVESVLRIHREYLSLPPPDRLVVEGSFLSGRQMVLGAGAEVAAQGDASGDRDPDRDPDEIGHDGGGGADQDLPRA